MLDLAESQDTVSILAELAHQIELGDDFENADSEFEDGKFFRVIVSGNAKVRINRPDHFVNPLSRFDVNGSGDTTAADALRVINFVGREGSGGLPTPDQDTDRSRNFVDVNGDLEATALDALNVINFLGRQALEATPENEQAASPVLVRSLFELGDASISHDGPVHPSIEISSPKLAGMLHQTKPVGRVSGAATEASFQKDSIDRVWLELEMDAGPDPELLADESTFELG